MSEREKALPLGHEYLAAYPTDDGRFCVHRREKYCGEPVTAHLPAEPAPLEPVAQESEHVDVFARTLQRECFSSDGADIGKAVQMIAAHDAALCREAEALVQELVGALKRVLAECDIHGFGCGSSRGVACNCSRREADAAIAAAERRAR